MTVPVAVSIAGSDPSGGAGIQADLKTFSALGVYGATVVTALTAQNTRKVAAVEVVRAELIAAQIDAVFGDLPVAAVKIGMLADQAVIAAVAAGLERFNQSNVVLDPVMSASVNKAALLAPAAIDVLRQVLLPRSLIITPNLPEAAALLEEEMATTEAEVRAQAERLLRLGSRAVLITGGHAKGSESVDFFVDGTAELRLPASRIATANTHGAGCTLAAAITAGLAKRLALPEAVAEAKTYVTLAIAAADRLSLGTGRGPVHHFHQWW
jgi:hydroxymethylpyrimidine/phosphomethylpyrimidine kinase